MPKKASAAALGSDAPDAVATGEKAIKKKSQSKASKAGLVFPIPKINKRMARSGWTERVGGTAPVWLSAICEYMAREIVEAAGKTCTDGGKHKRITPRDVILAIDNDPELNRVFAGHKALVGDKLKGVTDEIALESDKRYKDAVAGKAAAAGGDAEEDEA